MRALLSFALLLLILLPPHTATAAAESLVIPASRFGAIESYYRPAEAAALAVGWDRVIFEWRYLQPNGPADWDTSHIPDQWLQDAANAHREIVGLIKNAPYWATGSDLLGAPPLGLEKPINDPTNYFSAFMTRIVTYYSTRWNIHHWFIYNEPDIRPEDGSQYEFSGSEMDYYHIVKVAYKTAHAADSKVVVHLAGMTWWHDVVNNRPLYLTRFLHIALKDPEALKNGLFFDVLSIHVYGWTRIVWDMSFQLKSITASVGFPKPIWIDEVNARPTVDGDWHMGDNGSPVSLDEQASFIIQASALGLGLGAERIGIYRFYDDQPPEKVEPWGLIRHDGTHRPGYDALRTVIREFSATTSARRTSQQGVSVVKLIQPGRVVTVLWNETDQPITIHTPFVEGAQLLSPVGAALDLMQSGRAYELVLPPCHWPCFVAGEPRVLIETVAGNTLINSTPPIYEIINTLQTRID